MGLVMLFTGAGKGKTTAALGQALRAAGHGKRVCIVQFVKGKWRTGEGVALGRYGDLVQFHVKGCGFIYDGKDVERCRAMARDAWSFAREKVASGGFDLVILDELTYLVHYGIVSEEEVLAFLRERPGETHIVITGRHATEGLIEAADLVTEMREVKHPLRRGLRAQEGIEY
jgi:cob(I)alamin adenosyltransferase